jgi:hypothetical protein
MRHLLIYALTRACGNVVKLVEWLKEEEEEEEEAQIAGERPHVLIPRIDDLQRRIGTLEAKLEHGLLNATLDARIDRSINKIMGGYVRRAESILCDKEGDARPLRTWVEDWTPILRQMREDLDRLKSQRPPTL